MAGFGFHIARNANNRGARAAIGNFVAWILTGGVWNDARIWRDDQIWEDG